MSLDKFIKRSSSMGSNEGEKTVAVVWEETILSGLPQVFVAIENEVTGRVERRSAAMEVIVAWEKQKAGKEVHRQSLEQPGSESESKQTQEHDEDEDDEQQDQDHDSSYSTSTTTDTFPSPPRKKQKQDIHELVLVRQQETNNKLTMVLKQLLAVVGAVQKVQSDQQQIRCDQQRFQTELEELKKTSGSNHVEFMFLKEDVEEREERVDFEIESLRKKTEKLTNDQLG
ncbi:hypothetical protein BGX23_010444 [Mortierella sp. AD031]|nr:hypothetical protein BGX23_010444 [Mortierella sp. AD031]